MELREDFVQLKIFLLFFAMVFVVRAYAFDSSNFRLNGAVGIGSGGAVENGTVRVEAPLALYMGADYSMSSRYTLGFEHYRSFAGSTSSIGLSGFVLRYYPWTPQPQKLGNSEDLISEDIIFQKNIVPYLGFSAGMGQANFPPKNTTQSTVAVVAPYLTLKTGLEYPFTGSWGLRGELSYGQSVAGNGTIEMIHLLFGFYYLL